MMKYEIVSIISSLRCSLNHILLYVKVIQLGNKGEIIQQMLDMKIMTEREKIQKLIALNIAKAMAVEKGKK